MTHSLTYLLTDNLKARDASASKKKSSTIANEVILDHVYTPCICTAYALKNLCCWNGCNNCLYKRYNLPEITTLNKDAVPWNSFKWLLSADDIKVSYPTGFYWECEWVDFTAALHHIICFQHCSWQTSYYLLSTSRLEAPGNKEIIGVSIKAWTWK